MSLARPAAVCAALLGFWGCAQILGIEETELDPDYSKDDDGSQPDDDEPDDEPDDDGSDASTPDVSDPDASGPPAMPDGGDDAPAEPGSDFRCVGSDWLTRSDADTIEIIATIADIETQNPVAGMQLRECKTRLDLECKGTVVESDERGVARVEVRRGFDGYLRLEGPAVDAGDEYVGYLWYFSQPLYNTYTFPILAMKRGFRDGFFYGDVERDPGRGEIAVQVTDCTEDTGSVEIGGKDVLNAPGVSAAGIRIEVRNDSFVDDQSREFYFSDAFPVSPPTATSTDDSGLAGFLNVKPGRVPIQARPEDSEQVIARDTLLVVPDFLTTVRLLPDPG